MKHSLRPCFIKIKSFSTHFHMIIIGLLKFGSLVGHVALDRTLGPGYDTLPL